MFCRTCGVRLAEEDRFCGNCGAAAPEKQYEAPVVEAEGEEEDEETVFIGSVNLAQQASHVPGSNRREGPAVRAYTQSREEQSQVPPVAVVRRAEAASARTRKPEKEKKKTGKQ